MSNMSSMELGIMCVIVAFIVWKIAQAIERKK